MYKLTEEEIKIVLDWYNAYYHIGLTRENKDKSIELAIKLERFISPFVDTTKED